MAYTGTNCCAVCCPHHVFGEKYERNGYMHFVKEEAIPKEEDEAKDPHRFDAAFELHQRSIRSFCTSFEKLLPEIRSLVYEYLLADCTTQYVLQSHAHRAYCHSCTDYFFPRSRMPLDPGVRRDVWRFSEYTGGLIGKEIAEAWYRNARFMVYAGDGLVDRWLSQDIWARGVIPAEVVREVRVHVPEAECNSVEQRKPYRSCSAGEDLSMLKRLGNKRVNLTIEVEVMRMEVLWAIADLVYDLRSSGFTDVKVCAHCSIDCRTRENRYFRGLRKDECSMGCKMRDIGYIFDVRREVFEQVFGKGLAPSGEEGSLDHEYSFRWRHAILNGNADAIQQYAEHTDGRDIPLVDHA